MKIFLIRSVFALFLVCGLICISQAQAASKSPKPILELPDSSFWSAQTREALQRAARNQQQLSRDQNRRCGSWADALPEEISALRRCQEEVFYQSEFYKTITDGYQVSVSSEKMAGVPVEVFVPRDGVAERNRSRVLINLHGGGFMYGARTASHMESIPIAGSGAIKVVSVDYRMAPQHKFPAASKDVAAVYRELLKHYPAQNIGIYGCSSGGLLAAQALAWFEKEALPVPGAIGMLCSGAWFWSDGDSGHIVQAITGYPIDQFSNNPYLKTANVDSPLVFPAKSPDVLKKFPPSLLISSTRDDALSAVVVTHNQLVKLGVAAELHIWEGMRHAFLMNADLPESREAYSVIVNFFEKFLGAKIQKIRKDPRQP